MPGNPILTAADWPSPVNAVFNPAAAVVDGETVVLARVEDRRGHLPPRRRTLGRRPGRMVDRSGAAAGPHRTESRASNGGSKTRAHLGGRARPVGDHLHGVRPGRDPAVYLATTEELSAPSSGTGSSGSPRTRTPSLLPNRVDGKAGSCSTGRSPPSADHTERSSSPGRSTCRAGVRPNRCCCKRCHGAWWDSVALASAHLLCGRRSGDGSSIYHGVKETVSGVIYRVGLALVDLDEPPRRPARPRIDMGVRSTRRRTNGRATCRTSSFPVASSTIPKNRRGSASTTGPPTPRSASRPPGWTTCSTPFAPTDLQPSRGRPAAADAERGERNANRPPGTEKRLDLCRALRHLVGREGVEAATGTR